LRRVDEQASFGGADDDAAAGSLTAPMPGKVVRFDTTYFLADHRSQTKRIMLISIVVVYFF
jgi:hypothetical protein